jgi:hypothetical protein
VIQSLIEAEGEMMSSQMQRLDTLGIKHGTDKSSTYHDYLNFYERHFHCLKDKPIKLLEIGVLEGASLAVWEEYFAQGTIIGVDIDPETTRLQRRRVLIETADQSNIEELVGIGMKHGPFDIVIEDGSHMWEHQITSFRTLFPFVKGGGIYVVEDLQTNFGEMETSYRGVATISCVDYLKKLVDLRVADDQTDISKVEDPFLRTYGRRVREITFFRRACLIEKEAAVNSYFEGGDSEADASPKILAHIANRGDVVRNDGWMPHGAGGYGIQGFEISMDPQLKCNISYRARDSFGNWTDWVDEGAFVGTRGKGQNLTGYSIRIGANRRNYIAKFAGKFGDAQDVVFREGGEDCVAPSGFGSLCGMQVIVRATQSN